MTRSLRDRWVVVPVGLAVTVVAVALATAPLRPAARGAPVAPSERVVVIAVPDLGVDDVAPGSTPALHRLSGRGSAGALVTRGASGHRSTTEALVTLAAGERVRFSSGRGGTVVRTGPVPEETLGSALARAGVTRTVVGAEGSARAAFADRRRLTAELVPDGEPVGDEPARPAAATDPAAVAEVLADRPPGRSVALAVLDDIAATRPGRVEPDAPSGATGGGELRRRAVALVDRTVAAVVDAVGSDPGTVIAVIGVTGPTPAPALSPIVIAGPGVEPGIVTSPGTGRPGLATLIDVAPTVLQSLGVAPPAAMTGRPLLVAPGPDGLAVARRIEDRAQAQSDAYGPSLVSLFVGLVVVSALAAAWLLAARRAVAPPRESSRVVLAVLVLATAAWPVASFLVGVPGTALSPAATIGATWVLALAIGGAAGGAGHRAADPVRSVVVVAATTVAVITVDLVTGGRLQATTVLGHSPLLASRFNGVGNAAYGTYAGAGLVLVALLATRGRDRSRNLVAAGALLAVLCVVDVAPTLGNDVGGVLSLVPIGILLLVALSGRRLRLVHLAVAAGALVIGMLTLVGVDALRAVDQRTHAGQLALAALDDRRRLWDTVDRKWAATVRSLGYTAWTRLLPPIAAVVAATFSSRRGRRVAGPASRYAPASLAVVALAVLGFLTNDAGSLVLAMAALWLPTVTAGPALLTSDATLRASARPAPVPGDGLDRLTTG